MVLDLANMSDSREKAKAARDSDLGVYLPEAHRDPSCTKKTGDAVKKQKLTRSSSYSLTQQDQLYPMREHMLNKHSARRTDDQKDDTRAKHKTKAKNVPGGGTPWPSLGAVDVAHTSMHISNETSSRSESTATSRFSFPTARLSVCDAPHNASATGGGMMQSATATDHDQLCNLEQADQDTLIKVQYDEIQRQDQLIRHLIRHQHESDKQYQLMRHQYESEMQQQKEEQHQLMSHQHDGMRRPKEEQHSESHILPGSGPSHKVRDEPEYSKSKFEETKQQLQQTKLELDSMRNLVMTMKDRKEGNYSEKRPTCLTISLQFDHLFGQFSHQVIEGFNYSQDQAKKEKCRIRLCEIFKEAYRQSKVTILEMMFKDIFSISQTGESEADSKSAQEQADGYGHALGQLLDEHRRQNGVEMQPPITDLVRKVSKNLPDLKEDLDAAEKALKVTDGQPAASSTYSPLAEFVQKAVDVAWNMVTTHPPMVIDDSETQKNDETQKHRRTYGVDSDIDSDDDDSVLHYYKPALYDSYKSSQVNRHAWTGWSKRK